MVFGVEWAFLILAFGTEVEDWVMVMNGLGF